MRFMNWSYDQLMVCPDGYMPVISEEAQRLAKLQQAGRRDR